MSINSPRKTISVASLMKETLARMSVSIAEKLKDGESTENLIGNYITKLHGIYELDTKVPVKSPITDKKTVRYDKYVTIFPTNIRKIIYRMPLDEIGFFFSLVQFIEYNSNLLCSIQNKKQALQKRELVNFLQITNEKLDIFLANCYEQNILLKLDFLVRKNSIFCSPSIATMKSTSLDFNKKHGTNLSVKGMATKLSLNIMLLNNDLFKKNDQSERLSIGKETLGFLIHLVLLMDIDNKVKAKNKSTIENYISNKIKTKKCSTYLINLEKADYIHMNYQRNEIIVNPDFARNVRTYYFDNTTTNKFRELKKGVQTI